MFKKPKSIVGLDLGRHSVKAVEIQMEGSEPVITAFSQAEIGSDGDRSEAIAKVFQEGRFRTKNVVSSVSGQAVVVRYITMPQMSDSELQQAVRFESDKFLPFDREDVQLDCQKLVRIPHQGADGGTVEDQISVVLAACRNDAMEEHVAEIKGHGLLPVAVEVDVFALANAWELCGLDETDAEEEGEEHAIALVDVGATCTSINVLASGETCFSREIGIGGSDMTQAAARRLGLDLAEAEVIKRQPDGREAEVSRAITPVLEDLVSEISLSLDYVESREGIRVEEVLLSGGGVLAPGTVAFIEQAVGRSTRTWNPLEGLRVAEGRVNIDEIEACASSLAVAIGLASRACAA